MLFGELVIPDAVVEALVESVDDLFVHELYTSGLLLPKVMVVVP